MKVLIVEDEHKVVDYLRSGLTEQGWVVDIAMDGEEGTHLAIEYDYDMIVLDVMLPRRDGFAVLKALRLQKSTPVIMLTARDHINDRVRGLREGADDYLTKSFSFLELVERLHALARRMRAQESMLISVGDLYVDLIGRRQIGCHDDRVVAGAAFDDVVAGTRRERIRTGAAGQGIVAATACDDEIAVGLGCTVEGERVGGCQCRAIDR